MDKIINSAKKAIGRGETPDPKAESMRLQIESEAKLNLLEDKESELVDKVEFLTACAKEALRSGDSRKYNSIKVELDGYEVPLQIASTSVDTARAMIGMMASQDSMDIVTELSDNVMTLQQQRGINPEKMQSTIMNIRESAATTEAMTKSMKSMSSLVNGSKNKEQGDPLKAKLMAEIKAESQVNGFGETIDARLKDLE